jgi:uncharacterized protein (DUF433 family)
VLAVIGKGAYAPQAARLLRIESSRANAASVHRWAFGYSRRGVHYPPAVRTEIAKKHHQKTVTFLELVELMHISSLLESGISWHTVREAVLVARRLLRHEMHPFAHRRWFADAKSLYMDLGRSKDAEILCEMAGDAQVVFPELLQVYLKQIEFDGRTGLALKWFPLGAVGGAVVLDPERSLGLPIVSTGGVRTDILAQHYSAGDSITSIAAWYRVPEHEVEAAIDFEEKLLPASA